MTALVTNIGLADVIAAWAASPTRPLYFQLGLGSGQTAAGTDLIAPIQSRVRGESSQHTTDVAGDTYRVTGTVMANAPVTVSEVGVFDGATGSLKIYGDFDPIKLARGDSLVFQVDVIASQG